MLVNTPVSVPLLVIVPLIVGFWAVPYATPLAVTESPTVTLPPVTAAVDVMPVADVVVTVGNPSDVKLT